MVLHLRVLFVQFWGVDVDHANADHGGLGLATEALTRATILLFKLVFKLVVAFVCLVVGSVTTLKFSRAQAVTPSVIIWHTLRSSQSVYCPASFDWCNVLLLFAYCSLLLEAPPILSSLSNLPGGFNVDYGGPQHEFRSWC